MTYLALHDRKATTIKRHVLRLRYLERSLNVFDKFCIDILFTSLKLAGKSNNYANTMVSTIRLYAAFIGADLALQKHPFFKVKKSDKAVFSEEEVDAFLSVPFQKGWHKERYEMWNIFWELCVTTGARMGEIASLTIDRVDFGLGILHLTGKTGERQVTIPEMVTPKLKDYIANLSTLYLFPAGGQATTRQTIGDTDWGEDFHKRVSLLGIKRTHLTPYSIRHTFGTQLGSEDVNLFTIKEAMGHSNIKTTEQYMHCSLKTLRKAQTKLPYVAKNLDPLKRLQQRKEVIKHWMEEDSNGLKYEYIEDGDSFRFECSVFSDKKNG